MIVVEKGALGMLATLSYLSKIIKVGNKQINERQYPSADLCPYLCEILRIQLRK